MRNRSDNLPRGKKLIIIFIIATICFLISFVYIEIKLKAFSSEMSGYYCKSQISEVMGKSVANVVKKTGAEYSDLTVDIFDENGKFVSSEINSKNTNALQSMIISEVNKNIIGLADKKIEISAGTLSGIILLNGKGPKIDLKLVPVGSVEAQMRSEFESAGINQICHKISIDVEAEIKAVYSVGSEAVRIKTNYIIAENVIIGEVPDGIIYR